MTPSLLNLPPELRLQIYRYLLHDTAVLELARGPVAGNKSQVVCLKDSERSATLHVAILATCRRIHEEALAVLYSQNHFVLRFGLRGPGEVEGGAAFPYQKLAMLRYLTVLVFDHPAHRKVTPTMVAETLHWLCGASCSLSRFRLQLCFLSSLERAYHQAQSRRSALELALRQLDNPDAEGLDENTFEFMFSVFARDSTIAQAVAAFPVTNQVEIFLVDQTKLPGLSFESIAQYIASAKGWSCRETQGNRHFDVSINLLQHKWFLQPAG